MVLAISGPGGNAAPSYEIFYLRCEKRGNLLSSKGFVGFAGGKQCG
jgi:hypothetical protein